MTQIQSAALQLSLHEKAVVVGPESADILRPKSHGGGRAQRGRHLSATRHAMALYPEFGVLPLGRWGSRQPVHVIDRIGADANDIPLRAGGFVNHPGDPSV